MTDKPINQPDGTVLIYFAIISFILLVISQIVLLGLKYSDSNLILFFSILSVFLTSSFYYWFFDALKNWYIEIEIVIFGLFNICGFIITGYLTSFGSS